MTGLKVFDVVPQPRIQLMQSLLASLNDGHQAMLDLDLFRIGRETGKQAALVEQLKISFRCERSDAGDAKEVLDPELLRVYRAIREALRLQLALLRRGQHKLTVIANTLSGSSTGYGPVLVCGCTTLRANVREQTTARVSSSSYPCPV